MNYVIDASVAVKWLIKESYRQQAKLFLHISIDRLAPDLILLECTNAIRRKVILKQITQKEGDEAFNLMKDWQQGLIQLASTVELLERAYELSKELEQHPVPDCLYLALAEQGNCQLVTADKKFYNRVQNNHLYAHRIVWIETPPSITK